MRQHAHQDRRRGAPGRVGQLQVVPLRLIAGVVRDLGRGAPFDARTRFAARTQFSLADLSGQGLVAGVKAQRAQLAQQDLGPHVRVVGETLTQVGLEGNERIGDASAHAGLAVLADMGSNRLAVATEVTGDRRDRPPARRQGMCLHGLLLCEHVAGLLSAGG